MKRYFAALNNVDLHIQCESKKIAKQIAKDVLLSTSYYFASVIDVYNNYISKDCAGRGYVRVTETSDPNDPNDDSEVSDDFVLYLTREEKIEKLLSYDS